MTARTLAVGDDNRHGGQLVEPAQEAASYVRSRFSRQLAPLAVTGGTIIPAWSPDGRSLAFLEGSAEDRRGWLVDLAAGDIAPLVADVVALREAIREATGEPPAGRGLPFAHLAFAAGRRLAVTVGAAQVIIGLDSGEVTKQPDDSFGDIYLGASETARSTGDCPLTGASQPNANRTPSASIAGRRCPYGSTQHPRPR